VRAAHHHRAVPAGERLDGVRPLLGTEREEKVDHAELDEFAELAQRVVYALLRNKPITHTITRENVLRADSEQNLRTINGTSHLLFGMGTSGARANLPTAARAAPSPADEGASSRPSASRSATGASCAPGAWTRSAA
jgi:hypothetical protein